MDSEVILILGGARSGKSLYAQQLAKELGGRVLFVATAAPLDEEMRYRIELHKKARPKTWRTVEATTGVAEAVGEYAGDNDVVILDCLTLLVSNVIDKAHDPGDTDALQSDILDELSQLLEPRKRFIIVSNEVGMGLVPDYPVGRVYRDLLGRANQFVAQRADKVYLMIAGIPLQLKGKD